MDTSDFIPPLLTTIHSQTLLLFFFTSVPERACVCKKHAYPETVITSSALEMPSSNFYYQKIPAADCQRFHDTDIAIAGRIPHILLSIEGLSQWFTFHPRNPVPFLASAENSRFSTVQTRKSYFIYNIHTKELENLHIC